MWDAKMEIRGARANNLQEIDVDIPKRRIVCVTGVSGSGKSSLVFDTIGAEARRQLSELFSAYARNRLAGGGAPDVDEIRNLSPAVVVDQKRVGGNLRSTVDDDGSLRGIAPALFALWQAICRLFECVFL